MRCSIEKGRNSLTTEVNSVDIWTDGACKGNPGMGGWGALLRHGTHEKELWGGEPGTTNNRMELMAVIQAMKTLKRSCRVIIHTDSQYVQKGMTEWLKNWKQRGWRTANKQPVWLNRVIALLLCISCLFAREQRCAIHVPGVRRADAVARSANAR